MRRICLVGAGNIASVHAEALQSVPGCIISAVVDPAAEKAVELARAWRVEGVFGSIGEALAADCFDCAHVLVPPDRHADAALPVLAAGKPVLLEKPLAVSEAEAAGLVAAAARSGAVLGVNQNFVHHPAFHQLRETIAMKRLGRPNFVDCIYNVPLRQLAARQFGHWMFAEARNILLEQAVHPLSQIASLAGPVGELQALAGPALEISPGVEFYPTLTATLTGAHLPAQLRFAVGQSFPFWQISVVCDDGVAVADILTNRFYTQERGRWLEAVDSLCSGLATARQIRRAAWRGAIDYALSTAKLRPRSDAFFLSMRASIGNFHAALDTGRSPDLDGSFGAALVSVCARLSKAVFPCARSVATSARSGSGNAADVAVLGGTGFIGRHVVQRLLETGLTVSVMARSVRNLPAIFADERVHLRRGDIRDADGIAAAIDGAAVVVNLAHGGGSGTFEQIHAAMVGGAETVARACLASGARLIHVGSIASLYLGPDAAPVTGMTSPDPKAGRRADYARAKALCDRMLLAIHEREGLDLCILRPGVVVGEGTSPFHSGLGVFNNEQHCLGWNDGRNPLPFVLAEDVAEAIRLACKQPRLGGRCYNLVGDVRLSAREFFAALAARTERPLVFHPQSPRMIWFEELAKWLVKRATGRRVALPALRDILSRGMMARFDCDDVHTDLGWQPVADRTVFLARAFAGLD